MEIILKNLTQIHSILTDPYLCEEIKVYRSAYQRLKVRFRNNQFVADIKHLARLNYKLQIDFKPDLFRAYRDRLLDEKRGKSNEKKKKSSLKALMKNICDFIILLNEIIEKTMNIYLSSQSHIKIGHLTHHLIIIRTTIARLRVCYRGLLVYASDIFMDLLEPLSKQEFVLDRTRVIEIMNKHRCKQRPEKTIEVIDLDTSNDKQNNDEVVGVLIDRKTMKPIGK